MYPHIYLVSPASLDISADDSWLSVDQEYTWECYSTGANPPPTLTWWNWLGQEVPSVQQVSPIII